MNESMNSLLFIYTMVSQLHCEHTMSLSLTLSESMNSFLFVYTMVRRLNQPHCEHTMP